jgi:hypothetical protein
MAAAQQLSNVELAPMARVCSATHWVVTKQTSTLTLGFWGYVWLKAAAVETGQAGPLGQRLAAAVSLTALSARRGPAK